MPNLFGDEGHEGMQQFAKLLKEVNGSFFGLAVDLFAERRLDDLQIP